MDKVITRRQAICGSVWIIIFCIIISLWPLRFFNETVTSAGTGEIAMESQAITTDYVVKQRFIAQYDKLESIRIYLLNESAGEEFNFILYDSDMNILVQQVVSTDNMEEMPGYCTVPLNQEVEVGKDYYFLVQGITTDFYVAYEETAATGNIYISTVYYGSIEDQEHCVIAEYDYKVPLRKGKTFAVDALLVLSGLLVTYFTGKYYTKRPEKNRLLTVEKTFQRVSSPLVIAVGAAAMVTVWPLKLYTDNVPSLIFYEISIVLAVLLVFYGIHHTRENKRTDFGFGIVKDRWTDWAQALMFAGAIQACCNYMNGLYEIHHTLAYREMLIYFGLALLVTYKKKEILNLANLIYLPIAAAACYRYYQSNIIGLEKPEEIEVVKLTVWVAFLAGVILINTIWILVQGRIRSISPVYGALVIIFFAALIIQRNTRGWPIYMACAFGLYYLRMAAWEKKERLLNNICNGILVHFLCSVIYCLGHRPYMYYIYYRYPFTFHTVTMTAVYLALVVGAALVKVLDAYRRNPKLSGVWKELLVFGFAVVYLLFTLSRTGYLAVMAMAVIVLPVVCLTRKGRWKALGQVIAMLCLAVVLCFPVTFTAQRIVPSLVAEPELHEIEELPEELMRGRVTDSRYYINIQRLIQVFQMKVLGMPEEKCIEAHSIVKNDSIDALGDRMLLVSADAEAGVSTGEASQEEQSDAQSYANGRFEIFELYYNHLNKEGHEDMYITLPDGSLIVHAHNIYLQVAYDHGIYVGVIFVLMGIGTFVQGILYFLRKREKRACAALPFTILLLFGVAGLTEWIFHPCNPIAYCLLLTLAPLLFDMRKGA